jgi:hypothetical protein
MAERHIQTVKNILTKAKESNKDPYLAMLEVRNTPVDGFKSPAQLVSGRSFRSILPISLQSLKINPVNTEAFQERRSEIQYNQKKYCDRNTKPLDNLHIHDKARMRIKEEKQWKPITITKVLDEPRSYQVKTEDGREIRRNRRHIIKEEEVSDTPLSEEEEVVENHQETKQSTKQEATPSDKEIANEKGIPQEDIVHVQPRTGVNRARYGRRV